MRNKSNKAIRRWRRRRREALVHSHLERVSRELLDKHRDVVRKFIGRNAGIYALYSRNRLYYVGLASKLSSRLKIHLKDRHGRSWDRFSIYLTIKDQHLKEIESLILRIAKPAGNKVTGKTASSRSLDRRIVGAIKEKQELEVREILGRSRRQSEAKQPKRNTEGESELAELLPMGAHLRGTLKDKVFRAVAKPGGRIRMEGVVYNSLSSAASAALKRPTNGWWFWHVERSRRNWVRLSAIRRAGTPVYRR